VAAYLVAGDEDICEGVAEAQDHGVRVTLLGVPGVNQSRLLVQQSDGHRLMPDEFWRAHFRLLEPAGERPAAPGLVAETAVAEPEPEPPRAAYNGAMRAAFEAASQSGSGAESVRALLRQTSAEVDAFERMATEAGREFARELLAEATPVDIERLVKLTGWQVPRDLDARLLRFAEQPSATCGSVPSSSRWCGTPSGTSSGAGLGPARRRTDRSYRPSRRRRSFAVATRISAVNGSASIRP
jgi:hypothetical protein